MIKRSWITIVSGWGFRYNKEGFFKYHQEITSYFKPKKSYLENIENLFLKIAAADDGSIVVGVHIRRGDYSIFEGGKHFFEWDQYADCLKQLSFSMTGKKIIYLLCSNEPIPASLFQSRQLKIFTGTGDKVEDLYALAKCDFILGPPSTYSLWASYYGNVPLYMIRDLQRTVTEEDFLLPEKWMN